MLDQRVLTTLKYFDLQELPLTLFELHQYLLPSADFLKRVTDDQFELLNNIEHSNTLTVGFSTLLTIIQSLENDGKIASSRGYYVLAGREHLIDLRLRNHFNGLKREKLISRYLGFVRHLPFVRGVALAGSQALGQERPTSDIDLLIITDPNFMWTARTLMSAYFQILGLRRHGQKTANRFCLNHYLANIREVDAEKNLYKAVEYAKLRPVVYAQGIKEFQEANIKWLNIFLPNFNAGLKQSGVISFWQRFTELLFNHQIGLWLEEQLCKWQSTRIRQDQFVFIRSDELSFHPESKHESLLKKFFE